VCTGPTSGALVSPFPPSPTQFIIRHTSVSLIYKITNPKKKNSTSICFRRCKCLDNPKQEQMQTVLHPGNIPNKIYLDNKRGHGIRKTPWFQVSA
jgi:hypothetical protein